MIDWIKKAFQRYKLRKAEREKSRKLVRMLFANGRLWKP